MMRPLSYRSSGGVFFFLYLPAACPNGNYLAIAPRMEKRVGSLWRTVRYINRKDNYEE